MTEKFTMKRSHFAWIFLGLLIVLNAWVILEAPIELNQGPAQKIFYWHVPCALTMLTLYIVGGVASALYLIKRRETFDAFAVSTIEVAFLFCTIVLATGMLWAKPVWGTWWTWEPRLTSTLFVWLVFLGYFILRANVEPRDRALVSSAILAIFGCLDIPIIVLAVKLWKGIHPQVLHERSNLPDVMWKVLALSFGCVVFLTFLLVRTRYQKEKEHLHGQ